MKLKIKQGNEEWKYIEVNVFSFMKCYFIMTLTIYGILLCVYLFILLIAMLAGMSGV